MSILVQHISRMLPLTYKQNVVFYYVGYKRRKEMKKVMVFVALLACTFVVSANGCDETVLKMVLAQEIRDTIGYGEMHEQRPRRWSVSRVEEKVYGRLRGTATWINLDCPFRLVDNKIQYSVTSTPINTHKEDVKQVALGMQELIAKSFGDKDGQLNSREKTALSKNYALKYLFTFVD